MSTLTTKKVLAVMDAGEIHLQLALPHFSEPPIVVDLATIPEGEDISFYQRGELQAAYCGKTELANVGSVWWRQHPRDYAKRIPFQRIDSALHDYAKSAVERHAAALGSWRHEGLWMSRPSSMMRADEKAGQLQDAYAVGFLTPETLQTSSPDRARAFIRRQVARGGCVAKTTSIYYPKTQRGWRAFWSTKVAENVSLDGLTRAPAIFQQFISGTDIRVVVVGTELFAAKITSKVRYPGNVSDWRVTGNVQSDQLVVEPHNIPENIQMKCLALCQRLGIVYGAFDFVCDDEGGWWFLEVNSTGANAFIELATGLPIAKTTVQMLERA